MLTDVGLVGLQLDTGGHQVLVRLELVLALISGRGRLAQPERVLLGGALVGGVAGRGVGGGLVGVIDGHSDDRQATLQHGAAEGRTGGDDAQQYLERRPCADSDVYVQHVQRAQP